MKLSKNYNIHLMKEAQNYDNLRKMKNILHVEKFRKNTVYKPFWRSVKRTIVSNELILKLMS